jgi:hypothetical protein
MSLQQDDNISFSFLGLNAGNSNRKLDVQTPDQINTSFPVALLNHMRDQGIHPNYLTMSAGKLVMTKISAEKILGDDKDDTYFGFEASCENPKLREFAKHLPRADLFITSKTNRSVGQPYEMKLVVVPDSSTRNSPLEQQGPELVVRPDTIAYEAAFMCASSLDKIKPIIAGLKTGDLLDPTVAKASITSIAGAIHEIAVAMEDTQFPFLCMPVWRTVGYTDEPLGFDVFFISDAAFAEMVSQIATPKINKINAVSRPERAAIWLYQLLKSVCDTGKFDHDVVFSKYCYNFKNDKAFALNGVIMNHFIKSKELSAPRVSFKERGNLMSLSSMKSKRIFADAMQKHWNCEAA